MCEISEEYTFTLDDEARKFAEENLNETDETRKAALCEIKQWLIEERPDLHAHLEDKYLLEFLRGCKFRIERTKTKLTNYYTMRRDEPAWFTRRDPQLREIQELVNLGVFIPLKMTHENRLVVIIRVAAHDPKVHKQDDVFKTGMMILDIAARESELCQIYGCVAIFDMEGLTLAHGTEMTPKVIKRAVYSWQNYHIRPKQLEFINAPVYVNVVLNIFKSFMKPKMKERVRIHFSGTDSLLGAVDRKILPPEYGGDGDSVDSLIKHWNDKLLSYREWLLNDEKYKAD